MSNLVYYCKLSSSAAREARLRRTVSVADRDQGNTDQDGINTIRIPEGDGNVSHLNDVIGKRTVGKVEAKQCISKLQAICSKRSRILKVLFLMRFICVKSCLLALQMLFCLLFLTLKQLIMIKRLSLFGKDMRRSESKRAQLNIL